MHVEFTEMIANANENSITYIFLNMDILVTVTRPVQIFNVLFSDPYESKAF